MSVTLVKLDDRQHATVLAALRYYQKLDQGNPASYDAVIYDIATNNGTVAPLDDEAIDELCEHVNCSPDVADEDGGMIELPEECSNTVKHALSHLCSAVEAEGDDEQVQHDLHIALAILKNILEEGT